VQIAVLDHRDHDVRSSCYVARFHRLTVTAEEMARRSQVVHLLADLPDLGAVRFTSGEASRLCAQRRA
jgi:hypothetical protein